MADQLENISFESLYTEHLGLTLDDEDRRVAEWIVVRAMPVAPIVRSWQPPGVRPLRPVVGCAAPGSIVAHVGVAELADALA